MGFNRFCETEALEHQELLWFERFLKKNKKKQSIFIVFNKVWWRRSSEMIGIHTVLWFSWFFWKMRWNYSGFCNCLSVFGPEIVEFVDYHEIHFKNPKRKYAKTVGFYRPKSERVSESFVSLCNSRVRKWKKRKRKQLQNIAFLRSAKKKLPEPEE